MLFPAQATSWLAHVCRTHAHRERDAGTLALHLLFLFPAGSGGVGTNDGTNDGTPKSAAAAIGLVASRAGSIVDPSRVSFVSRCVPCNRLKQATSPGDRARGGPDQAWLRAACRSNSVRAALPDVETSSSPHHSISGAAGSSLPVRHISGIKSLSDKAVSDRWVFGLCELAAKRAPASRGRWVDHVRGGY